MPECGAMPAFQTRDSAMSEREWTIIGGKRRASATVRVKRKCVNIKMSPTCVCEINESISELACGIFTELLPGLSASI